MRSTVKTVLVASVIVLFSIRPNADAALAPYAVTTPSSTDLLPSLFDHPYGDLTARMFVPRPAAPDSLALSPPAEPPVAMIAPKRGPMVVVPAFPRELMSPAPVDAVPTMTAPQVVVPTEPPPAAPIVTRGRFSNDGKVSNVPAAIERPAVERHNTARRAAVLAIKFDGPAGAPFAHTRFCLKYPNECRIDKIKFRGGPVELTPARREELVRVNNEVNRAIVATDMHEPAAQEKWLIGPKFGDCNDYAVTKRHQLIARGWPARALLLAEVVTSWGEHHLVLVVRTSQGDLVADSLDKSIRNWTKTPYQWVRVESPVNPLYWSKVRTSDPDVVAMAETGKRF